MWLIFIIPAVTAAGVLVTLYNAKPKVKEKAISFNWDDSKKVKRSVLISNYITNKLKRIDPKKELEDANAVIKQYNIKSDVDLFNFVQSHFRYISDPLFGIIDIQSTISEIMKNGGGDCDDYAWFSCVMLYSLGYKAYYVTLFDPFIVKSHVTCVYIKNNNAYCFDQGTIAQVTSKQNIVDFYSKLYKTVYNIIDIRNVFKEQVSIGS